MVTIEEKVEIFSKGPWEKLTVKSGLNLILRQSHRIINVDCFYLYLEVVTMRRESKMFQSQDNSNTYFKFETSWENGVLFLEIVDTKCPWCLRVHESREVNPMEHMWAGRKEGLLASGKSIFKLIGVSVGIKRPYVENLEINFSDAIVLPSYWLLNIGIFSFARWNLEFRRPVSNLKLESFSWKILTVGF